MAAPDRTPAELAAAIHSAPIGSSQQGYTLQSRTLLQEGCPYWEIVVTKGPGTWTCHYGPVDGDVVGKIIACWDDQGRYWVQVTTEGLAWH